MGNHSKFFSPSGSHGWLNCPQWSSDSAGDAAKYGTICHELAEYALNCWKDGVEPELPIGQTMSLDCGYSVEVDQDMVDIVEFYVFDVQAAAGFDPKRLEVEKKVFFDKALQLDTEESGTADAVINWDLCTEVHDLKTGTASKLYAEGNTQLIMYAIGELGDLSQLNQKHKVKLVIHQPTLNHYDDWLIDVAYLKKWLKQCKKAIEKRKRFASGGRPRALAGETQCQWCAKKADCKVLEKTVLDMFDDDHKPEPQLSIVDKYVKSPLVESWIKAVKAKAFSLAERGELEGFKLVEGRRGNAKWVDDVNKIIDVCDELEVDLFERKIRTPTQVKKEVSKKDQEKLDELVIRSQGKPTIVEVSDPRQAIAIDDDFDILD